MPKTAAFLIRSSLSAPCSATFFFFLYAKEIHKDQISRVNYKGKTTTPNPASKQSLSTPAHTAHIHTELTELMNLMNLQNEHCWLIFRVPMPSTSLQINPEEKGGKRFERKLQQMQKFPDARVLTMRCTRYIIFTLRALGRYVFVIIY